MALSITHTTVATGTDAGNGEIHKAEWNEAHTITGLGTGVETFLQTPSSANLAAALTDETGTGANVFANTPTLVTPILGTPTSGTLTNCTGLPISTGVSGLAANVATFLATPSSANLAAALTDETGTGTVLFSSQIDNTAYGSSWNGVTTKAPTQDAVWDALQARDFPTAPISNNYAILNQSQFGAQVENSGAGITDTIYAGAFYVSRRVTITELGFVVTNAAAINGQVAIYPDASGVPGATAVVTTGNLSMASTVGVLETLGSAITLEPRTLYWACVNRSNSTAQYLAYSHLHHHPIATLIGATTTANVVAAGGSLMTTGLTVARTFGTWGDLSGLGWTAVQSVARHPALLVRYQ